MLSAYGHETGVGDRQLYLAALPAEGWESQGLLEEVIVLTAYSGVRVEPYRSLRYVAEPSAQQRAAAMEWDANVGELRTFPAYDQSIGLSSRLRLAVHEGGHAGSPDNPANAAFFGGEEGRAAACEYNRRVADQCLITEIYLSPYHESLAERYNKGEINEWTFLEETWAIHMELSLVYAFASWLTKAEADQRQRLAELRRERPDVTYPEAEPLGINWHDEELNGLGPHLVNGSLYGVHNMAELKLHVRNLDQARRTDLKRFNTREPVLERVVGGLVAISSMISLPGGNPYTRDKY